MASAQQQRSDTSFQVVILAGGECKRMYPLTSAGTVKALLPVGNRPLISYPLRNLSEAGIKKCIVVRACCCCWCCGCWLLPSFLSIQLL